MKKFLRIALAVALIVMSLASVMGTVVAADTLTADTAVAAIGTTYYASLDEAIDAAQDGDVISLLKDTTASVKNIAAKKITIKGEGTTKPVIAAGSAKCAFWLKDAAEVKIENIAFKEFASKNVILYGTQDAADANTYKLTIDNCEFEFSASGAIYAYNCAQAEIKVTNSSFKSLSNAAAHSAFNAGRVPTVATYTKFENNTLVGCGQEINTGSQGVHKSLDELYAPAVPTGTVASVTKNGTTTYYSDFSEAVIAMNRQANTVVEAVLYADVELNTPIVDADTIIFKAASGTNPTVTVNITNPVIGGTTPYKGAFIAASATKKLEIEGINFVVNTEHVDGGLISINSTTKDTALGTDKSIILTNVNVTAANCIISQYTPSGGEYGRYTININGGTYTVSDGEGSFVCIPRSVRAAEDFNFTFNLTNAPTVNVAAFYEGPNDGAFDEETNTSNPIGYFVNYADDATAKAAGFGYRVGDTIGGKAGEVYFETAEEAFAIAAAGVKVYDITGNAPVEAVKPCEHTFTDEVVAPTCTEEGYTKHTCSKCGTVNKDTTVPALGHDNTIATCTQKAKCNVCGLESGELAKHKYVSATCTKKSTCSVCGDERGELAKHTDNDKDNKCDKCEADLTPATTTPVADNTEEKGCGGTVTVAGLALVAALGSCAIFVEKKRK